MKLTNSNNYRELNYEVSFLQELSLPGDLSLSCWRDYVWFGSRFKFIICLKHENLNLGKEGEFIKRLLCKHSMTLGKGLIYQHLFQTINTWGLLKSHVECCRQRIRERKESKSANNFKIAALSDPYDENIREREASKRLEYYRGRDGYTITYNIYINKIRGL